ncbi:MAG: hypothetical protein A2268_11115 [Candidatus Raymondbacteria bacterium RifOxyA12_full_50_37]|uniref:Uncharacterized protein n=1 Tax=Candidatus Raymondbacteria bacterium RIFOXYD12_FULL_49_13 TaxID=1817890 RepID=A0A1F7F7Q1_UNCRA|nr:MAG: hypothetical protein A2268_11115 [Candidatus Raymondbacteria bacterium RifOxyA12_full_50_37]OGJ85561.1 MAG: hypothetical protein A2248_12900 [Candidatus Raymondbacteria bacterium RIFOXYA2_FULL_49_16]OGJ95064.1 MAG: hypothetical protein A2453_07600 [Candidatus Raymondbacteria bacterium RIFOXYC2_FULL_50_21]OGJ95424.1 MAG: hypothetical protein A2350_05620 [Candidatus Raymondbacteria bacterium RifOxyB12_full_50_8]OGK02582.1 MAG: hypothetical protein A2519_12260 [Candidatus Raymondbacteria b
MKRIVLFFLCFTILINAQGLRGGSSTDIDDYCAVFNQTIIDTLKGLYAKWQLNPGWNTYRVALLGNSNTYGNRTWEPFSHTPTGVSNQAAIRFFKDSTFAKNNWVAPENCKGSAHGNQGGAKIFEINGWVYPMLAADKPMVATLMAGTNNVNVCGGWCAWPDTMEINVILNKLLAVGVMPIILSIPPINDDDPSWTAGHDADTILIPFNNKLKILAEQRGLPFIDLYTWCMNHGGTGLLSDWAHSNNCGANGAVFSDSCLQGGEGGSFYNAWNYMMLIAINDIFRYVVWGEPLESGLQDRMRAEQSGIHVRPNPFNPSTMITVYGTVDDQSVVAAELYSLKGNLLHTVNGRRDNAYYSFVFNGAGLPSGVYIARVKIGGKQYFRKIILQK